MSPSDALAIIDQVTAQVPLKRDMWRAYEQAMNILDIFIKEKTKPVELKKEDTDA